MELGFSIGKLPWRAQIGAFVAVSALALGGFYYFYAMPAYDDMAARQARLESMRGDVRKARAIGRTLPQFQAQVSDLEGRLENLKPVLPEQKDVGDLLRRIHTLAAQSNLTVEAFTPKPISTKQLHAEWPIVLQLDGTYHNLGTFFDKISKVPRIINISELSIRSKDKPLPNSTITAECTATTFVLLETPAAQSPAPAAAGTSGR
jgi:type IV pilus assembly protein PilO